MRPNKPQSSFLVNHKQLKLYIEKIVEMSKILFRNFVLFSCLVGLSTQELAGKNSPVLDENLVDMMLSSRNSPEVTKLCFQNYNSKLEAYTLKYESGLNQCNEVAANATKEVDKEVQSNVDAVIDSQQNICNIFSKCTNNLNSGSYEFFNCSNDAVSVDRSFIDITQRCR